MTPALSVILITPDRMETIRRTLGYLRQQTACDRLEIVVAAPRGLEVESDEFAGFASWRVTGVEGGCTSAEARAAGVRVASAPVIAFTEDHSFPCEDWAAALIAAHAGDCAAVGPRLENGNPGSMVSWANFLIEYGAWAATMPRGPIEHLAPHNSSYKRALLLDYSDQLTEMLHAETVLFWDLRRRGFELLHEPAAVTRHFNFSSARNSIALRIAVGRMFASSRARSWPMARRAAYTVAGPLIPLVRLARILKVIRALPARRALLPRVLPMLIAGLAFDALGEMLGYAFGNGGANERSTGFEFHRDRYFGARDRRERALA